ncbi:MAG: electron transport complex subunit RsxA [Treponema sp.]|nr:electron transport complex subunit RsxA [Treponema sp.]
MNQFLVILLNSMLSENIVFIQCLALCPFIDMTNSKERTWGAGLSSSIVILLTLLVAWPVNHFVLLPLKLEFLQILAFVLLIAFFVFAVESFFRKSFSSLYEKMHSGFSFILANVAVLGITLNCIARECGYAESIMYAIGSSLGLILSLFIMNSVQERIRSSEVPIAFKGKPILFISASIISLVFLGFKGLVK